MAYMANGNKIIRNLSNILKKSNFKQLTNDYAQCRSRTAEYGFRLTASTFG